MIEEILTRTPGNDIIRGIGNMIWDIQQTRNAVLQATDNEVFDIIYKKCEVALDVIAENTDTIDDLDNKGESQWIPDLDTIYLEKLKEAGL